MSFRPVIHALDLPISICGSLTRPTPTGTDECCAIEPHASAVQKRNVVHSTK